MIALLVAIALSPGNPNSTLADDPGEAMKQELKYYVAAEAAKTKAVDGKEHPASDFAYVGDPDDISTWSLADFDEAHVRDALARFDQDEVVPASAKKKVAKKLAAKAKTLGIDASGFKEKYLASEADMSLDERQALLNGALLAQFGRDDQGWQRFILFESFDDYIIAQSPQGKLYRIGYTIKGDEVALDGVQLGQAQEVTTAYVPVAESCEFLSLESDAQPQSGKYRIGALKAGWGLGALNGQSVPHYYPPEFVKTVAEALNGKPFGRRHPDQRGPDPTGATDPDRIAGWLEGGAFDGSRATATVNLFTAEADLRSRLDDARQNKKLNLFAVSMLAAVGYRPGVVEGKQCLVAEALGNLYSVDLCARAGAGGEFLTAASFAASDVSAAQLRAVNPLSAAIAPTRSARSGNSSGAASAEGATMKKSILQLLEALRQKNAGRCAELSMKFATTTEAEYPAFLDTVTAALAEAPAPAPTTTAVTTEAAQAILADAQRLQSRTRIATKLAESKLPKAACKLANDHLEEALASEANLADTVIDAEISRVRDAFAAFSNVGRVHPGAKVTLDSADKLSLAMESAIGVKESIGKGVPAFRGLREAYITVTGDYDLAKLGHGGFTGHVLASEAVITGDFPNILLNSMTKRLLQDWAELSLDGLSMLYTKASISDYKLQDRVREGYFGLLPIVNEDAGYAELAYPTDERVSYQVAKRGGFLSISEETIRNDDLGAIARFPGRLARAGRWTLKNDITNFFATNPNYGADSVAWFNAAHNNLLATTALSATALITARTQLRLQTEKNAGFPLGLPLNWIMVPAALESTAIAINQTNTAGSNQFFHAFGDNNERIIVNELLDAADNDDWYFGTAQENAPFLEMGFLDGIEQPQIFLANQPTIGRQFTNDELQYKTKFVYNGAIIDYRGVGKGAVD